MINIISDNLLKAYVRNIDGLENVLVEKIRQQMDFYRPLVIERMLEAGYRLHVLGWGECMTDVPELKRKRSLRNAAGYCGNPSKNYPAVISLETMHPDGNLVMDFPNMLVHEIGHAIPKVLMTKGERRQLWRMHHRAKWRYGDAERRGESPPVPDVRYVEFKEEYLPIGLEFSVQKGPLRQPMLTKILGPDGECRSIVLASKETFPEDPEDGIVLREPYGLPRTAVSLKISDPELFAFCRQFLKEDKTRA